MKGFVREPTNLWQRGLQLAFLNGCSSKRQAEELRDKGVPAVIGTSEPIDDSAATLLSKAFYEGLAAGRPIEQAWLGAKDRIRSDKLKKQKGFHRGIELPGEDSAYTREFPWELYIRPGAEIVKDWNLPRAASSPLFGLPLPEEAFLRLPSTPFVGLHYFREGKSAPAGLASILRKWLAVEKQTGKPLIVILDQVEEAFTRPIPGAGGDNQEVIQTFKGSIRSQFEFNIKTQSVLVYDYDRHSTYLLQYSQESGKYQPGPTSMSAPYSAILSVGGRSCISADNIYIEEEANYLCFQSGSIGMGQRFFTGYEYVPAMEQRFNPDSRLGFSPDGRLFYSNTGDRAVLYADFFREWKSGRLWGKVYQFSKEEQAGHKIDWKY